MRRTTEAIVRDRLRAEWKLRQLNGCGRYVLQELAVMMDGLGGEIEFAGDDAALASDLADWLRLGLAEMETQLANLRATGAIVRTETGITFADWVLGDTPRARSARANGAKSRGRPRKNAVAGQTEMLLPIAGGGVAAAASDERRGSQRLGHAEAVAACTATATQGREESNSATADFSDTSAEGIACAVGRVCGIPPSVARRQVPVVQEWLREGATPELIRATVLELVMRPSCQRVNSLKYFNAAVLEAHARGDAPAPAHAHVRTREGEREFARSFTAAERLVFEDYTLRRKAWIEAGNLPEHGPSLENMMRAAGFEGWSWDSMQRRTA